MIRIGDLMWIPAKALVATGTNYTSFENDVMCKVVEISLPHAIVEVVGARFSVAMTTLRHAAISDLPLRKQVQLEFAKALLSGGEVEEVHELVEMLALYFLK